MAVSPAAIPGGGPGPEPQAVVARVEVTDAESGVFIPGADVSVLFLGGKASKKTDTGGNAAFSKSDFSGASSETLKGAVYRVEKPGYTPQEKPFVEGQIVSFALPRATGMISPEAQGGPTISTPVLVVGGIAAAGLIALLILK